ncbi:MAG: flavin reductase family protein [Firmicutes bacterium HGW-Firmicutes-7]|nr:MAG: flavin reductase family protein [Firmicutes bacterium HGW-Firmicutes-7]
MSKIQWKPGNMLYPLPAVLISCGDSDENYNMITISWAGTICTNPPMTSISVKPNRHSYELIKKTKEFVINLTTESMVWAVDYCGVKSGRDVNKFAITKLSTSKASVVNAPLILESPVNIECKVIEIKPLGSHDLFIAEVVAVHVDDTYIDQNDKFHLNQSKPICYSHGHYFGLGDPLGSFGYSVKKKQKKKKKPKPE